MESFINQLASQIDFITKEWIINNAPIKDISEKIDKYIEFHEEIIEKEIRDFSKKTYQQVEFDSILSMGVDSFNVYQYEKNDYTIGVFFKCVLWYLFDGKGAGVHYEFFVSMNYLKGIFEKVTIEDHDYIDHSAQL